MGESFVWIFLPRVAVVFKMAQVAFAGQHSYIEGFEQARQMAANTAKANDANSAVL